MHEQDLDVEDEIPLKRIAHETLDPVYKQETSNKKRRDNTKAQVLFEQRGFCREGGEGDGY